MYNSTFHSQFHYNIILIEMFIDNYNIYYYIFYPKLAIKMFYCQDHIVVIIIALAMIYEKMPDT